MSDGCVATHCSRVPEDREVAVLACRAPGSRRPGSRLLHGFVDVLEVAAARALQQVPADRRDVAQLPRRAREQRLRRPRVALAHARVRRRGRCCARRRRSAGRRPAARSISASAAARTSTSSAGVGDAELHQVDEVRAAGRGTRARRAAASARRRPPRRRRARRRTASLRAPPRSRATMFDVRAAAAEVAAHPLADLVLVELGRRRPRDPSASPRASSSTPTAEQICPGVQ